ncbi:MAG: GNAT family N-acetyltransferase [Bdellovibrionales bacterium]|nr:GNAT family N-acetyltransferase [Bdellovibrionales bacterium]
MTIAEGVPASLPNPKELIHENAILGCRSWSKWKDLHFEQSNRITWYRSAIRDILFNSVLDADLHPEVFPAVLREVSDYCERSHCSLAWLVPNPAKLTDFHRSRFEEANYRECTGTTGMYLSLTDSDSRALFHRPPEPPVEDLEIKIVKEEDTLLRWAKELISSYRFPKHLAQPWFELHRDIGFRGTEDTSTDRNTQEQWEHQTLFLRGEMIGTSSLFFGPTPHSSSFANLSIRPEWRGRGIGSYLVRNCLQRLVESQYETVTLYASQDAYDLYLRMGFIPSMKNIFFVRDAV